MSGLLKAERGSPDKQHTGLKTVLGLRHLTWLVTLICHFVSRLAKLCGCGEASQCPIVVRDFCACCCLQILKMLLYSTGTSRF